jgi:hypothetical protein
MIDTSDVVWTCNWCNEPIYRGETAKCKTSLDGEVNYYHCSNEIDHLAAEEEYLGRSTRLNRCTDKEILDWARARERHWEK